MKIKHAIKVFSSLLFFFQTSTNILSQEYGTGAFIDDSIFANAVKAPPLSRGDFRKLPEYFSLKKYSPTPGHQGNSSTCTGWSTSYSARTILEAVKNNWDKNTINQNTFSPSYVYNQIRQSKSCDGGTNILDGLEILKNDGVLPFSEFGYDCERSVNNNDKVRASTYKIKEYREIATRKSKNIVLNIKKSISQSNPVVLAFNCPKSFFRATNIWLPKKEEYKQRNNGHAVTIIGYNDNLEGGAFEIINSWGIEWGNEGFTWIKYSDMEKLCIWAAELVSEANDLSNMSLDISIKEIGKSNVYLSKVDNSYSTTKSFITGSKFQLNLLNKSPNHIYVFSYDKKKGAQYIYPMNSRYSDYFAYSENHIVLPSENHSFELDEDFGKSSLVIVVSTESIKNDIDRLTEINTSPKNLESYLYQLSTNGRKVFFDSKLKNNEVISMRKKSSTNIISVIKIDFLHASREAK